MRNIICSVLFLLISLRFHSQSETSSLTQERNGKKYSLHTVEKGQSIYAISKLYNVSVEDILFENPSASKGISSGQKLYIPQFIKRVPEKAVVEYLQHNVQKSETVYGISKKYGLKEGQLLSDNPELAKGLKEGMVLKIASKPTITKNDSIYEKPPVDSTKSSLMLKTRKEVYHLGLLLPLDTKREFTVEQLLSENKEFPFTTSIAIDFYEGVKSVIDSLQKEGKQVNVSVFDANEKDSLELFYLANDSIFNSCDLVIGPFFQTGFKVVSSISKEKNIPLISPFTNSNKILFNNSFSSKVTPSIKSLAEEFAVYCVEKLSDSKLILVNSGKAKDQFGVKSFRKKYNELISAQNQRITDTILEVKGLAGSKEAYSENKKNIYLVLSEDEVFVTDYLTQMKMFSGKKKEIKIFGMKKWIEMDHLDPEYLNSLKFSYFTNQIIDYNDSTIQYLVSLYRNKFKTDPLHYFFAGYDIANYYLRFLFQEGPQIFTSLDKFPKNGLTMDFKFYSPSENTGFENNAIRIVNYIDYKLVEEFKQDER